jgi:hypothetical protein
MQIGVQIIRGINDELNLLRSTFFQYRAIENWLTTFYLSLILCTAPAKIKSCDAK